MFFSNTYHSPFAVEARVVKALMLRDIRTRFFGHGLGYLVAIAWPLVHILILIGIWSFLGRTTPYGVSLALWFATGLAPVMSFIYASRWIMMSAVTNKSLMGFPVVKFFDVLLARAILEAGAAVCMVGSLVGIFYIFGIDPIPAFPVSALKAMSAAVLLGVGLGIINGVIAAVLPLWVTGYALLTIVFYLLSGIMFIPDQMPEAARAALAWNPLVHAVEWMRAAYYGGYTSRTLDTNYLLGWGFGTVFFGLLCVRYGRRFISPA